MPDDGSGGGFVDKFVTLLGYKVDTTGLKKFKSGMKSAMTTARALGKQSRRAGDSATRGMAAGFKRGVRRIKVQLKLAIRAVKRWREANKENLEAVEKSWGKMTDKGKNLLSFVGKLTAAVTGLTGAFLGLLGITNKETAQIEALAESVQVSSEFLRGMSSIVEEAGFNYENVVDMVEELNNKMGESSGLPEQMTAVKESFKILGLEFSKIQKLKPEDQLTRILEAARNLKDHQQSVAAVDMLMGGESNKVVGLIRAQGEEFDELLMRRIRLNLLDEQGKRGAVAFTRSLAETTIVAKSAKDQFFGLVGDGLRPLLEKFNDWTTENREFIQTKIAEYAERTVEAIKDFAKWVKETLPKVTEFVDKMGGMAGIVNKVRIGIIALGALKIVGFFGALLEALVAIKGIVVAGIPLLKSFAAALGLSGAQILILVGLVAIIIFALQDLYTWFQGGDTVFGQWGEDLVDALFFIQENWERVLDFMLSAFGITFDEIKEFWFETFTEMTKFLEHIPVFWKEVFDEFVEWAGKIPGRIAEKIKAGAGAVRSAILDTLRDIPGIGALIPKSAPTTAGAMGNLAGSVSSNVNNNRSSSVQQTVAPGAVVVNAPQNTSPKAIAAESVKALRQMMAGAASAEGVPG